MNVWVYTLLSVLAVSLISLVGIFSLLISQKTLEKLTLFLVSFAAGGLFGDAFIHLLPEAVENYGFEAKVSLGILGGILTFFILEKFIAWRHCHIPTSDKHPHPLASMNLIGDGVHNFIDGVIISASFLVSFPLGIATTIAVIFHEIPQEIGDFGILMHGGFSKTKALAFNLLSSCAAIFGAIFALVFSLQISGFIGFLIPFAVGGFIYIAGSDLIPELHKETKLSKSILQLVSFLLGIGVMSALKIIG